MIKLLREDFDGNIILGSLQRSKLPSHFIFKGKCYMKRPVNKEAYIGYIRQFPDMEEVGLYCPRNNPTDPTPLDDLDETNVNFFRAA